MNYGYKDICKNIEEVFQLLINHQVVTKKDFSNEALKDFEGILTRSMSLQKEMVVLQNFMLEFSRLHRPTFLNMLYTSKSPYLCLFADGKVISQKLGLLNHIFIKREANYFTVSRKNSRANMEKNKNNVVPLLNTEDIEKLSLSLDEKSAEVTVVNDQPIKDWSDETAET